jgi:hypothetical protein
MVRLSWFETQQYIDFLLSNKIDVARQRLFYYLQENQIKEGQFCESIIEHQLRLKLTGEQWFELLRRMPNPILRSSLPLEKIISETQLKRLNEIS